MYKHSKLRTKSVNLHKPFGKWSVYWSIVQAFKVCVCLFGANRSPSGQSHDYRHLALQQNQLKQKLPRSKTAKFDTILCVCVEIRGFTAICCCLQYLYLFCFVIVSMMYKLRSSHITRELSWLSSWIHFIRLCMSSTELIAWNMNSFSESCLFSQIEKI